MNDENWKQELKEWKSNLKPFQIKLLNEGARSQSQALLLNDMWCEWKELASKRRIDAIDGIFSGIPDPWIEKTS